MPEWRTYCRGEADLEWVDEETVVVTFGDRRQQRVDVREEDDAYELSSIVARAGITGEFDDLSLRAWQRNRSTKLVGFRLDRRGRLVGEAWVPKAGLSRDEFLTYVRSLAAECDRFEFQLTGRDRE